MLKFTLKITINAPTCFDFTKTIIREPTVCASLKLQYWRQLKYFVIELFGRVAAYYSVLLVCVSCTVHSET